MQTDTRGDDPATPTATDELRDPIGPRLEAELAKLSPTRRAEVEPFVVRRRRELETKRISRAATLDDIDATQARYEASRSRFRDKLGEWREGLEIFAMIAAIFVGGAGLVGTCIGVLVALIRAGWRAGASL